MGHVSLWSRERRGLLAGLVCGLLCAATVPAQATLEQALRVKAWVPSNNAAGQVEAPAMTTEAALRALADEAGVIFVGTVTGMRRQDEAVLVEFQVEEGIRGAVTGSKYVLREWAGMWPMGTARYVVGQRALLLLHAPSVAGFSSPVGGADGVVPVQGQAVGGTTDLRWVAARALRTVALRPGQSNVFEAEEAPLPSSRTTAAQGIAKGFMAQQNTAPATSANGTSWASEPVSGNVLGQDVHAIDRGLVTDLLRAWSVGAGKR